MYCPNCGKDNSNDERFCRSCGLSLQVIAQVLVDELSATESGDSSSEIKRGGTGWQNPLLFGFLMLTLGIVIVIFGKTILGEQLIADIGTVMAFLSIGLLGFKGASLMMSQPNTPPQSRALPEGEPTTRLPPAPQTVERTSITEHTTRHLEPIYSKRKAE